MKVFAFIPNKNFFFIPYYKNPSNRNHIYPKKQPPTQPLYSKVNIFSCDYFLFYCILFKINSFYNINHFVCCVILHVKSIKYLNVNSGWFYMRIHKQLYPSTCAESLPQFLYSLNNIKSIPKAHTQTLWIGLGEHNNDMRWGGIFDWRIFWIGWCTFYMCLLHKNILWFGLGGFGVFSYIQL